MVACVHVAGGEEFSVVLPSFRSSSPLPKLESDVTAVDPNGRRRDKAQFYSLLLGIYQRLLDQDLYTSCFQHTPDRIERSRQVRVRASATRIGVKVNKHEVDLDILPHVVGCCYVGCRHLAFLSGWFAQPSSR